MASCRLNLDSLLRIYHCRLVRKMYFLLFNIAILFTNICATEIIVSYVVHPKGYRTRSNSRYQRTSELANYSVSHDFAFGEQLLDNCALFNTITIDSLRFPLFALLFISPLWKLLSLKLFVLISVD